MVSKSRNTEETIDHGEKKFSRIQSPEEQALIFKALRRFVPCFRPLWDACG
jgi:hypothetical protein